MEISHLHLLVLIIFTICSYNQVDSITVNEESGTDDLLCCMNDTAAVCGSLRFALSCLKNLTFGSSSIILVDGAAKIDGRIYVDLPNNVNVTFANKHPDELARISCVNGSSMLVLNPAAGSFVTFVNLKFDSCGPNVPSAVLVNGPLSIEFYNCTFSNNMCAGLNMRDANLLVQNCKFLYNFANQSNSFDIEFRFGNTSLGGNLGIMFHRESNKIVRIVSSKFMFGQTFVNKDATVVSHDTGKTRLLSNYYASGGGLSVVNSFSSSENIVLIKDCHFQENRGTYGGGLFLTFIHNTTKNLIQIENSTVEKNVVSQTGGGVLVSSWDYANDNNITIKNSDISLNTAMGGGAMKIIYNSKDPSTENRGGTIGLEIHDTFITANTAMSGAAIRLLSNLPAGRIPPMLPIFHNCTITGHRPTINSKEYPGAILSTRLGMQFYGRNYLAFNTHGSAIHISSGTIHVKGHMLFYKNKGLQGGAVYLADTSKIILYPGSYLEIAENHANFRGGGIYVEATTLWETTYPYNPGCFLQYSEAKTPPSKWKAKVEFRNNSVSLKGAAVFLNSLVGCLWEENPKKASLNNTLRWSNKITYRNNFIFSDERGIISRGHNADIATDTYDFNVTLPSGSYKFSPGETFALKMEAKDQLGHNIYSVPLVEQLFLNTSDATRTIAQQYFVLSPGDGNIPILSLKMPSSQVYEATADVNDTEIIRISATQSNFLVEKNITVATMKCHPGFIFDGKTCVCNLEQQGIERCSEGRYVFLKTGYWGGIIDGQFITNICPRGYCDCVKKDGKSGCLYDYQKPDTFCKDGRVGVLCGRCEDGLALSLRPTECIDCEGTGLVLGLSMIAVCLFAFLIIYFNPNIPTDLRGILFYVQVLPFLFKPNDEIGDFVNLISGVSDLGRPTEYPLKTCAVPGLGNLGTTALNYVTPGEVLLILAVIFFLRRKIRLQRDRPFQCFLVLMILMYKYLVETSFALVHCVDVGGKKVFFYDGSWECYQGYHLLFLIIAVLVWFVLLFLPIPILFYVVHNGADSYLCFSIPQQVIDAITVGLKRHTGMEKCKCGFNDNRRKSEIEVELDNCSPCSEKVEKACDSCAERSKRFWQDYVGNERGWWWAIDFARRQLLVALYVFIQDWQSKQIAITIACSLIFAVHCLAWPYSKKNKWANRIEAVYLLALVLLANIQSIQVQSSRHLASLLILLLTYGFGGIYFLYKAIRFVRKFIRKRKHEVAS